MFFFGNRQQFNARAGQKENTCFFSNARPKSNARAHLKQKKKHSGLRLVEFETCGLGTTGKGSNGSCLASLPGVHVIFYIPVTLLLI